MKKAFAGKRKVLIIGTVFAIAIVSFVVILMVKQPNEAGKRAEDTENELPAEIKSEIEHLFLEPEAIIRTDISRWAVDTAEKRINIFVWKLTPENEQLHGKVINGWTINITYDAELMKEIEKRNTELERLKEIPEMQIAAWSGGINPRTGYKDIDIMVSNLTPENQQLRGKMIDGWKVNGVWKAVTPEDIKQRGK